MHHTYDPAALRPVDDTEAADAADASAAPRCAQFDIARETACADAELGRLWMDLFDDANP